MILRVDFSVRVKFARVTLLIILIGCSGRNPTTSFSLSVPPLKPQAKTIESIEQWDGRIVVITDQYDCISKRFHRSVHELDTRCGRIVPVNVGKKLTVMAVTENVGKSYALCRKDSDIILLVKTKDGRTWTQSPLPDDIPIDEPLRLAAGRDGMFLFSELNLWEQAGTNSWRKRDLKSLLGKVWEALPRSILVTEKALFIGYDRGEWGGATYVVPLKSGKVSSHGREIAQFNVCAIERDAGGRVWIAGGLGHLCIECAWLYVYSDDLMQPIIDQSGVSMKGQLVEVGNDAPLRWDFATDISGLIMGENGKPIIVAAQLGVFEVSSEQLTPVIKCDLCVGYDNKDYGVTSSPQGISIDYSGNIYIATRSLGVLMFNKVEDAYRLRQLTF